MVLVIGQACVAHRTISFRPPQYITLAHISQLAFAFTGFGMVAQQFSVVLLRLTVRQTTNDEGSPVVTPLRGSGM